MALTKGAEVVCHWLWNRGTRTDIGILGKILIPGVIKTNFAEQWSLDPTGNWTDFDQDTDGDGTPNLEQTRDHTEANEIEEIDDATTHVAHDAAGNMTKVPQPGDWSDDYTLTYDAWNRLVKVQDGETTVAEYQYDGQNRRTMKTVSGTARHFYYSSGWQVLEERVGASTDADCQYVWGERYIDDLVLRDRDSDGNPGTGSLGKSGSGLDERLYALQDPNFNVVALAESDGDIVTRYRYTAYGAPTPLNPNFTAPYTGTNYAWPYLYTARGQDPETGLMPDLFLKLGQSRLYNRQVAGAMLPLAVRMSQVREDRSTPTRVCSQHAPVTLPARDSATSHPPPHPPRRSFLPGRAGLKKHPPNTPKPRENQHQTALTPRSPLPQQTRRCASTAAYSGSRRSSKPM